MAATNISVEDIPNNFTPLISDSDYAIISYALFTIGSLCICLFGMGANVINIVVYSKMGIRDSISVQFLCLSASDLIYCAFNSLCAIFDLIHKLQPGLVPLDGLTALFVLSPARTKFYAISVLVTMLLSTERSCCVVLPFKVKSVFTKRRTVTGVIFITLSCLIWLVPEYLTRGLRWKFDPSYNKTRLFGWTAQNRINVEVAESIVLSCILPTVASVVMTVCAWLMISSLRKSSKVRRSSNIGSVSKNLQSVPETSAAGTGSSQRSNAKKIQSKEASAKNLSSKEARLAKTVVAVDLLFIICNMPKCSTVGLVIAKSIDPKLSTNVPGRYQNLITAMYAIAYASESVNASVNLLIYYLVNQKFRSIIKQFFSCFADKMRHRLSL